MTCVLAILALAEVSCGLSPAAVPARRLNIGFLLADELNYGDLGCTGQPRKGPAELYDLATDPGEREDVAARHPQVTRDLAAALKKWQATLPASYVGSDTDG